MPRHRGRRARRRTHPRGSPRASVASVAPGQWYSAVTASGPIDGGVERAEPAFVVGAAHRRLSMPASTPSASCSSSPSSSVEALHRSASSARTRASPRHPGGSWRPGRSVTRVGSPGASQTVAWLGVPVDERDVVGGLHRDPLQRRDAFGDGRACLQQVADDDRDAEAATCAPAPAERERHRQPAIVDAVEQAPQLVGHADHPRVGEPRLPTRRRRTGSGRSRSCGPAPPPLERGLRAAAQQRRRVVQREHAARRARRRRRRRPAQTTSARAPACGARAPSGASASEGRAASPSCSYQLRYAGQRCSNSPGSLRSRTAWKTIWFGRGREVGGPLAPRISARTSSRTAASGMYRVAASSAKFCQSIPAKIASTACHIATGCLNANGVACPAGSPGATGVPANCALIASIQLPAALGQLVVGGSASARARRGCRGRRPCSGTRRGVAMLR